MTAINATITQAYSQQGGDLPYFVGKQYGSGWLRTLGRFAFPLLKKVLRVAGNTAQDVLMDDKPILSSLKENTIGEVTDTIANPSSLIPKTPAKRSASTKRKAKRKKTSKLPPFYNQSKRRR